MICTGDFKEAFDDKLSEHAIYIGTATPKGAAVVGMDRFDGDSIDMHITSTAPGWASRRFLRRCFGHAFVACGCRRVNAFVRRDNNLAKLLCDRLGFVREGVMRKACHGHDVVVFGMLKEECRWLPAQDDGRIQETQGAKSA